MIKKKCTLCQIEKPITDFSEIPSIGTVRSRCKPCMKKSHRRVKNKPRKNLYMGDSYA